MFTGFNAQRRQFLAIATGAFALAPAVTIGPARAKSKEVNLTADTASTLRSNATFAALKQIEAGVLDIGYAEAGPVDGPVAILLHGWPYDIHTYVDVAPLLASKGFRVIVPYLRGYGTTTFLSADTLRNGQQAVLAIDIIALMDALQVDRAIIAGCDWGARTACILAALWPERVKALVCERVSDRQPRSKQDASAP